VGFHQEERSKIKLDEEEKQKSLEFKTTSQQKKLLSSFGGAALQYLVSWLELMANST